MKVTDKIHLIKCPHRTYFTSVGLFNDEELTLIDTGRSESPEHTIYPYIKKIGREPNEISYILLTHAHWDHCAGLAQIKKENDCKIGVNKTGLPFLENPNLLNEMHEKKYPNLIQESPTFEPVKADFTFIEGETIELGKRRLLTVHTPGHSIDSSCIIDNDESVCFSGDSFQGKGEGRPLIFDDADKYINSIKKISKKNIKTMVTGHPFPPFNRGVLKGEEISSFLKESIEAIKELEESILNTLSLKGHTLVDLTDKMGDARTNTLLCVLGTLRARGLINKTHDKEGISWRKT
jgi:glyoxylase-like metal-dependent hydrolase (beta-lactamase superfamily II)